MPSELTVEQRRVIPLVLTISLTSIMANTLLAPAIPDILEHFGRASGDSGLLVAVIPMPGILIAPVTGILADRHGRRRVLVPCLAIFGIAGLLVATAPTFHVMLAARFAQGFGAAGLVNLSVVLISDHFDGLERTHWLGRNSASLILALAIFPPLSGLITDLAGWRWALAPYGLALITAVVAWRFLERDTPHATPSIRQQLGGIGAAVRNRLMLSVFIGGASAFAVTFGAFLTAVPNHLEQTFDLSAGWRGLIIGLPGVPAFVTAFNFARLRRRVATGRVLIGAALMWVAGFTLIALTGSLVVLVIGAMMYGVADGALIPSLQDTASRYAPGAHRASVMATWTGFARAGQAAGPLVAGAALRIDGPELAILTGVASAAVMLALFLAGPVRRLS